MTHSLLTAENFGVSFADKKILRDISLRIAESGIVLLMGPVGSGKSTLLRTLAGLNRGSSALRTEGRVMYCGETLIGEHGEFNPSAIELPAIVAQKTQLLIASVRENIVANLPERASLTQQQQRELVRRLLQQANAYDLVEQLDTSVKDLRLGQQRLIALIRTMACNPRLVLVDEPTAGVSEADAALILDYLKQQAERRAIVTVLHHQQQAKYLGGQLLLIVDGAVTEHADTQQFFAAPATELGQMFVRTGSCCKAAEPEALSAEAVSTQNDLPPLPKASKSYSTRPRPVGAAIAPPSAASTASQAVGQARQAQPVTTVTSASDAKRYQPKLISAASNHNKPAASTAPSTQTQLSLPLSDQAEPDHQESNQRELKQTSKLLHLTQARQLPASHARSSPNSAATEPASPASSRPFKSAALGPRNFLWLLPGKLAGTPRPGLVRDTALDVQALARVGITQLLSLESEFPATAADLLASHGITGFSLPMPDMQAPTVEQAYACCERIAQLIGAGESVAVHCKAGIGRTGTMLVAYLIYTGQPAALALTTVRAIEPRWVQSQQQENFLDDFAFYVASSQKNVEITSANLTTT